MRMLPISTRVNKFDNDDADLLTPVPEFDFCLYHQSNGSPAKKRMGPTLASHPYPVHESFRTYPERLWRPHQTSAAMHPVDDGGMRRSGEAIHPNGGSRSRIQEQPAAQAAPGGLSEM